MSLYTFNVDKLLILFLPSSISFSFPGGENVKYILSRVAMSDQGIVSCHCCEESLTACSISISYSKKGILCDKYSLTLEFNYLPNTICSHQCFFHEKKIENEIESI